MKHRILHMKTAVTETRNVGSRKYPKMETTITEEETETLQFMNEEGNWEDVPIEYDFQERTIE